MPTNLVIISFCTFVGAFILCLIMTRVMISVAPKVGLVDQPGERRIHTKSTPRAGGIAIWISFVVVSLLLSQTGILGKSLDQRWLFSFIAASLILVVTGIIDDKIGVSAWIKLGSHIFAAATLFFLRKGANGFLLGIPVHWGIELTVWIIWTVALINAFNLIDGLDGLCGGLALISTCSLIILAFFFGKASDAIILLVMAGCLLGFLRHNFHPAKIFLGDTGSMFLGFFLASVSTFSTGERYAVLSLLLPVIVAGIPLIDVCLAVWRRGFRAWLSHLGVGKAAKIFGADQHHLHHRLLSYGLTQRKVAVILYSLAILASCIAIFPSLIDKRALGITVVGFIAATLVGLRYLAPIELRISGEVLDLMIKRPARSRLNRFLLTSYDALSIISALILAIYLETKSLLTLGTGEGYVSMCVFFVAGSLLALNAGRAHTRRWSRASLKDFASLATWLIIGLLFAAALSATFNGKLTETLKLMLMTLSFSGILLAIPRSITPFIRESVIDSLHRSISSSSGERPRVIVYGAGDLGELFIHHLKITALKHFAEMRIMGFIDDHPELTGRFLDGFRIRGTSEDLETLTKRWNLSGVILCTEKLSEKKRASLLKQCNDLGLTLYDWKPELSLQSHRQQM